MSRGRLLALGVLTCLVALIGAAQPGWGAEEPPVDDESGIAWEESLSAAMSRCATERKPVLISFSTRKDGDPEAPFY